jgi:orotate phosphoribosyltransferase
VVKIAAALSNTFAAAEQVFQLGLESSCTPIQSAPTFSAQPNKEVFAGRATPAVQVERHQPRGQTETLRAMTAASTTAASSSSNGATDALAQEFVQFAVRAGVLRFGEFRTKAGRLSPYFFNAGLFNDGAKLGKLAEFYARRLLDSGEPIAFDMLFGPAYKGIALAAALAVELARRGRNVPFAYNRKEVKDHGEGGALVGAPLAGRVLIVDDVVSAGTSVRESMALIERAGATPCGLAIALDRQEKATAPAAEGGGDLPYSAVQYIGRELRLGVAAVATLDNLLQVLRDSVDPALAAHHAAVSAYRDRYGV